MDIDKVFPGHTMTPRSIRSIELSYRRYGKLKATEKKIFDGVKHKYPPTVWKLALHIRFTLHKPLKERYFKIANKWTSLENGPLSKWNLLVSEYQHNGGIYCIYNASNKNYEELDKFLYKELIFEGFIPLDDYNRVHHKLYISANRLLHGTQLIYPKAFIPYTENIYGMYGIPGITSYKIY